MDFARFLLNIIRENNKYFAWMEERRLEWGPLMQANLRYLLEGKSFIFCTDEKRSWYEEYFLANINASSNRPLLPFFALSSLCKKSCESEMDIAFLNDLLEANFERGYIFFYIGSYKDKFAKIAKSRENSLLWLFDEQLQNSFYLSSLDKDLDYKLISLYKLLDQCLDGLLFSNFEL